MLQDADGKISGPRTVIAGFGAGVTESLMAVTPFESIKTTLYVLRSLMDHGPLTQYIVSMIENLVPPGCEDSCTDPRSSHGNVVSGASSRASFQLPHDRRPTRPLVSAATQFYGSSRKDMWRLGRN